MIEPRVCCRTDANSSSPYSHGDYGLALGTGTNRPPLMPTKYGIFHGRYGQWLTLSLFTSIGRPSRWWSVYYSRWASSFCTQAGGVIRLLGCAVSSLPPALDCRGTSRLFCRPRSQRAGALLHSTIHSKELKHDCLTRLDRDRTAGVNHAWNSRHRCRDRIPALRMAYLQSITMLSCPPAASRRHSPLRNKTARAPNSVSPPARRVTQRRFPPPWSVDELEACFCRP
jgi:hypothetical protein